LYIYTQTPTFLTEKWVFFLSVTKTHINSFVT